MITFLCIWLVLVVYGYIIEFFFQSQSSLVFKRLNWCHSLSDLLPRARKEGTQAANELVAPFDRRRLENHKWLKIQYELANEREREVYNNKLVSLLMASEQADKTTRPPALMPKLASLLSCHLHSSYRFIE